MSNDSLRIKYNLLHNNISVELWLYSARDKHEFYIQTVFEVSFSSCLLTSLTLKSWIMQNFKQLWGGMSKAQKIHCSWGVHDGLVKSLKSVWMLQIIDCHSIKKSGSSTSTIYRGQTISTGQSQFYFSETYLLPVVINRQLWCCVSTRSSLGHLISA